MGTVTLIQANLATLAVDAQVNPWNRNHLPWLLLVPHGVAGAIRRTAGWRPFWELWRKGPIPLGEARLTDGGRGPAKYLIHVAAYRAGARRSAPESVRLATDSAVKLAHNLGCRTVAFPLIGAGTGGVPVAEVAAILWHFLDAAKPGFEKLIVAVSDQRVYEEARRCWPGSLQ
jgi:O-acetyl-ADP-ribose deacetylase (regulator of RNase III)